jgi:DeoR family transcriptional regulator, glycerol-3-phosphate regulon repressor
MKPEERRQRIANLVKEASRASVEELAGLLDTSRETVRRDLALLSEQGLVRKVHGGAVYTQTAFESPLKERYAAARQEKLALVEVAARQFRDGDSLLIDGGTTTALFAAALGRTGSFTVITNSLLVARELRDSPHKSEVYLLGGRLFGEGDEVLGSLVIEQIQRLQADHAVLTAGAVDPRGRCLDFNAEEAYIARAMMASGGRTTILADSTKLGQHALFQVCEAGEIDRLVTDKPPPRDVAEALRAANVEVLLP